MNKSVISYYFKIAIILPELFQHKVIYAKGEDIFGSILKPYLIVNVPPIKGLRLNNGIALLYTVVDNLIKL